MSLLHYLCCCCFSEDPAPTTPLDNMDRVKTSIPVSQVEIIPDHIRKTTQVVHYSCPICFLYYSNIMYCDKCSNCMCIFCLKSIVNKQNSLNEVMHCPFCSSVDSQFKDWVGAQGKVYFDKSIGGAFMPNPKKSVQSSPIKKERQDELQENQQNQNRERQQSHIQLNREGILESTDIIRQHHLEE